MELIGLGAIALGFSIWAAMPTYRRRGRRKELGLPPKPDEDWRTHAPPWSDPKYFHRYGRRGP